MTGLVTIHRLSQGGANSVAVVEAGGFYEAEAGTASVTLPSFLSMKGCLVWSGLVWLMYLHAGLLTGKGEGREGRRYCAASC